MEYIVVFLILGLILLNRPARRKVNSLVKKLAFYVFILLVVGTSIFLARFSWTYARSHVFQKSNFADGQLSWHEFFAHKYSWLVFLIAMVLIVLFVLSLMHVGAILNRCREKIKKRED